MLSGTIATAAATASTVCRGALGTISGYAMMSMCAPVFSGTRPDGRYNISVWPTDAR